MTVDDGVGIGAGLDLVATTKIEFVKMLFLHTFYLFANFSNAEIQVFKLTLVRERVVTLVQGRGK